MKKIIGFDVKTIIVGKDRFSASVISREMCTFI